MRAVIIATGYRKALHPIIRLRPSPLINIGDRPVIYHIIEYLVTLGVKKFDLILSHYPEMIENAIGDGKRWGIDLDYHLVKDEEYPLSVLAAISKGWDDDNIILGQGDSIPYLNSLNLTTLEVKRPILFQYQDDSWTEWGIFPNNCFIDWPSEKKLSEIPDHFSSKSLQITKPYISARNFQEMFISNQTFMRQGNLPHLFPTTARKVEPNVWISRAVSIHPSVQITPPIFIGENCQINHGVKLGPFAVIENNCIIDNDSTIKDSIICQKSYVGISLNVNSCIVDRNTLINLKLGTQFEVREDFMLSEIWPPKLSSIPLRFVEKIIAILCLMFLLPFFIPLWIFYGMKKEEMLAIPSSEDEISWKTYTLYSFKNTEIDYFDRMPHLLNIIKGDIHFVGVVPRSKENVRQMSSDWKKLYLKSKQGIISIASINKIPKEAMDDIYAAEVYYAAQMGLWNDLKLFNKWFCSKMTTPL